MVILRATAFNLVFYGGTAICCFLLLPALLLPQGPYLRVIRVYFQFVHLIERWVLGLDYEVRGRENLPASGAYIVAAKHYSAYETMKLPLLFDAPVVIVKRELLRIPFWGWYAAKAGMIGIDRSNREQALRSMTAGAQRVAAEGRPLVIFPQGTRVAVEDSAKGRPYKGGIARMASAANLPVVPLAMNSGLFWTRKAVLKRPGTVVFEFLKPIPAGTPSDVLMKQIEEEIETASAALNTEGRANMTRPNKAHIRVVSTLLSLAILLLTLGGVLYSALWFKISHDLERAVQDGLSRAQQAGLVKSAAWSDVTGFPGDMRLECSASLTLPQGALEISRAQIRVGLWPRQEAEITLLSPATFRAENGVALPFTEGRAQISFPYPWPVSQTADGMKQWQKERGVVLLDALSLRSAETQIEATGKISLDLRLQPEGEARAVIHGANAFLDKLSEMELVRKRDAQLTRVLLKGMQKPDPKAQAETPTEVLTLPLTLSGQVVRLGILPIARVPLLHWAGEAPPETAETGQRPVRRRLPLSGSRASE